MLKVPSLKLISCLILLLSSCDDDLITKIEKCSLVGEWKVVAYDSLGKKTIVVLPQDKIFINFGEDGWISGNSSGLCHNGFSARYYLESSNLINIQNIFSSRAACPQSRYWQFLEVLDNVNRYKISDQLYLFNEKINTKISLKRERLNE